MAKPKQSDGKIFVTFGCREKWETRNIFPTNKERRTVNNCQLSKIAKKKKQYNDDEDNENDDDDDDDKR